MEKNKIIEVTNRDSGKIGYSIPDLGNLRRSFAPGETKKISFEELEKLSWIPGGKKLLKDYLVINDEEAAQELLGDVEPEYYYTKDTVKTLLNEGSLEQLQDTLEFAPEGVIELIKQEAVDGELDSTIKKQEIKNKTHFDVDKAIQINKESKEEESSVAATSKRRATPITASTQNSTTSRKSTPIIIKK